MSNSDNIAVPAARIMSSSSVRSEVGYPNGHLGYLTDTQTAALDEFKALLEDKGLYKRGPPASHDDPMLLRYLRARRWVPQDALVQFSDTEEWRQANDIDVLYNTIELQAYEESRRLYPQWTGRRDRRGIPLYVFEIRHLDHKTVAAYEKNGAKSTFSDAKTDGKTPPGLLRLFALYENLTRFQMPFCTQLKDREFPEVPITMSTNIVDISGVGLKQFWNLKNHMQAASQLATAHYPETLDRIFIIGAPIFFGTVWGWIKRWFDPITVSKIFILNPHEIKPTLEAFIEPRNIPKKYGGELDFTWGDLGVSDPGWEGVLHWENGHKTFPSGPMIWEDDADDKLVCIAMGASDGKVRRERVCTVPKTWPAPEVPEEQVEQPAEQPAATTATTTTTTTNSTEPTIAGENVTEGTQTSSPERQDEAIQTEDAVTNGEAIQKLTVSDEKTPVAPPLALTTTTAV